MIKKACLITAILSLTLLLSNCKKDPKICSAYTQISSQANLVDVSVLKEGAQEFLDTLAKYPQLQAWRISSDKYGYVMHCHIFFKGLIIFTADYMLSKDVLNNNAVSSYDSVITTIPGISLTPVITSDEAIRISRQNEDFSQTCITYQLGIWDINSGSGNMPKDYKLVWHITGTDTRYPEVVVDAQTGQVYYKSDGIFH